MPYAVSQTDSPPLTNLEKRLILEQLNEVGSCRDKLQSCQEKIKIYELFVDQEQDKDKLIEANCEQRVALIKETVDNMKAARDAALDKAQFYESAYRALTKKPGIGCWLKRIFTLGIARCS